MPAIVFYLTAGPLLFLIVVVAVIIYGSNHLSKKPVADLPIFQEQPVDTLKLAGIKFVFRGVR
jgi:hypothetical protein